MSPQAVGCRLSFISVSEVAKFSRFPVVARLERSSRRQRILIASLAAVALAFLGLRVLATIIVDRWWSHSVTDAPLWRVRIVAQSQLFLLAFVAILAILGTTIFSFGILVVAFSPPTTVSCIGITRGWGWHIIGSS